MRKRLTGKSIPSECGSIPAIAVPIGLAIATPDAATAVPTGLEAASPCSPTTARPESYMGTELISELIH